MLEWQLQRAEDFAVYDWARGEREFIEWLGDAVTLPGDVEMWRSYGVPLRVLRAAQRNAEGMG